MHSRIIGSIGNPTILLLGCSGFIIEDLFFWLDVFQNWRFKAFFHAKLINLWRLELHINVIFIDLLLIFSPTFDYIALLISILSSYGGCRRNLALSITILVLLFILLE